MYECDAPVSKRIRAVNDLTKNLPITASGCSSTSSTLMWFTCPLLNGLGFFPVLPFLFPFLPSGQSLAQCPVFLHLKQLTWLRSLLEGVAGLEWSWLLLAPFPFPFLPPLWLCDPPPVWLWRPWLWMSPPEFGVKRGFCWAPELYFPCPYFLLWLSITAASLPS